MGFSFVFQSAGLMLAKRSFAQRSKAAVQRKSRKSYHHGVFGGGITHGSRGANFAQLDGKMQSWAGKQQPDVAA